MFSTKYWRDGTNQIVGNLTSGFGNGDQVARSRNGRILGHSSLVFGNTRDDEGRLVSRNTGNVNLLFRS